MYLLLQNAPGTQCSVHDRTEPLSSSSIREVERNGLGLVFFIQAHSVGSISYALLLTTERWLVNCDFCLTSGGGTTVLQRPCRIPAIWQAVLKTARNSTPASGSFQPQSGYSRYAVAYCTSKYLPCILVCTPQCEGKKKVYFPLMAQGKF